MNQLHETAKVFYMVKGHIPDWLKKESEEGLREVHNQYLSRLWGNAEAYYRTDGFEEAWRKFNKE